MGGGDTTVSPYGGRTVAAVLFAIFGSGLLFGASMALPIAGFLSALLAPVPVSVARIRSSRMAALFAVVCATLVITILAGPMFGVWYLIQVGSVGMAIPEMITRGVSPGRSVLYSALFSFSLAVVTVVIMTNGALAPTISLLESELKQATGQALILYQQQTTLQPDEITLLTESMQRASTLAIRLLPALTLIALGLISATTMRVTARVAQRYGLAFSVSPFSEYRTPEYLIWALIGSGFALLSNQTIITIPAMNLAVPLAVAYCFQGIAVLISRFNRTSISGILKTMTTVMVVLQPYLLLIIVAIGVFDLWFDFRRPRPKPDDVL